MREFETLTFDEKRILHSTLGFAGWRLGQAVDKFKKALFKALFNFSDN